MDNSESHTIYLSVIVPAYNEEDRIELTLRSIHAYLSQHGYSFEVIVVNDGSKDRTSQVVSRLISEFPYIRLIDNNENRGKGWAVKQGMLSAKGEIRLFMDADSSTSIDQFERMIPYFEKGFDVVIGSRRISGAVISVHQPWLRENMGRIVNSLVRIVCGIPMQDTQAGFKAFSSTAAEKVFPLQTIWRWIFDVELLVISRRLGLRVKEVPIVWKNDERSNVKFKHTIETLRDIIKIRLNEMYGVYG
ncbi:MAG TPA: dolichyl-phosphate beta-glucosyltransferase [Thermodesulfobacteriota bacterium]|nr:dolichyl-phosphate beta-glucosyltransferase [Thermodesulfobacteriota bacterium]